MINQKRKCKESPGHPRRATDPDVRKGEKEKGS
jgi:hypothetical protein